MHRDDIRVSFHQNAAILLGDGPFGKIESVQDIAFVVDLRFGRVEVFGGLLVGPHGTGTESDDPSADAVDRKDNPSAEAVIVPSGLSFDS